MPPDLIQAMHERAAPALTSGQGAAGAELSIVVPTFKEKDNVGELVKRLEVTLQGVAWEVIFVDDDSPDGTADTVRALAATNPRVRCVQRIDRRGLSSACVEGMLSSSAPYVAVMDADLQHDEGILPAMLASLKQEDLDIVVGSRYVDGGGLGQWDESRAAISRFATRLSHMVVPPELKDPMSGFFMLRREVLHQCVRRLSALGFKILVDFFASSEQPLRFKELPYTFRNRIAGESKLDNQVAWDYGMLLLDKMIGHIVPARFVAFALIGGFGVLVHMAVLTALYKGGWLSFASGQASATTVAMVFNFAFNNIITYRDQQLKGLAWLRGLISFMLVCSVGAIANVGVANYLFDRDGGWVASALAGIVLGAVWNYAVTSVYTWGKGKKT
ncbi:MAG: glycosyltransferase family 2 protein [Ideonella sp.]|nr:glycosyltransferase family 2 protein [Ideonella sp.]